MLTISVLWTNAAKLELTQPSPLIIVSQGVEATTLVLRCVQYILQLQAQAMVRDLGFPRDITGVIQEYWSVYVSYLVDYHDGMGPMLTGDPDGTPVDQTEDGQDTQVNTDSETEKENPTAPEFKDKTEPVTPTRDLLDTQQEFHHSESESSGDDDDDDNVEEEDDYDEDKDHGNKHDDDENSQISGSEDDGDDRPTVAHRATAHIDDDKDVTQATATDAANFDPFEEYEVKELVDPLQLKKRAGESADGRVSKRRKGIIPKRDRVDFRFLAMRSIIGILYISSQHLKLPVVIGDFQR